MKLSSILALGALLFAGAAAADTLPTAVGKIALDTATPSTLYAGAGTSAPTQGVYKSTDGGLSWTLLFPMADSPIDIEIDPVAPSTLYVSDAADNMPAAIYKSTDGGANWSAAANGIVAKPGVPGQQAVIVQMAVDPVDEGIVYAGSQDTGLYKSTDGGQNWVRINQGFTAYAPGTPSKVSALLVDPLVPTTVYVNVFQSALAADGLYVSTDGGATWNITSLNTALGELVTGLAMDPHDHLHLAACALGVFETSLDGAGTWTGADSCADASIAFDPYYPNHILVSRYTDKTTRSSTDGGLSFGAASLSVNTAGLVFDPQVPSNVYAGTASGLYISRDDGASWTLWSSAAARVVPIQVPADEPTIQAGIDAAPNADSVIVAPGTYQEQLDFNGRLITVKSSGGTAVTILDGNQTGPIVHFRSGESPAAVLQGFTLQNASNNPGAGSAILIGDASPTIQDDVFTEDQEDAAAGSAISGSHSSAVILRDYFTSNTCGTSSTDGVVSFTSNSSPIVADNVFADNDCAAYAQTIASGTASQVYNDTFVGNTAALSLPGYVAADTAVTFTQNIIAFNEVGVHTPGYSGATMPAFTFNLVYGNSTADYQGVQAQTGGLNVSGDPLFVDWTHDNFRLKWGSPAQFAGNFPESGIPGVDQASATDFYGQARFLAVLGIPLTVVDLGAAEYEPPVVTAVAGTLQTVRDASKTGTLTASGADTGEPLLFFVDSMPAHGTLTITDIHTGAFNYAPAAGYMGTDSFTFYVADAFDVISAPAAVQVTVADAPATAVAGSVAGTAAGAISGTLSATQAYTGQALTFLIASQPTHGTLFLTAASGQFRYTPAAGFVGSDSFTFKVKDAFGTYSNTATESVSVNDVAAQAIGAVIPVRRVAFKGFLKATAAYAGQVLHYQIVATAAHGTVTITDINKGAFTYTPAKGYRGADSFSFKVTDQWGTASNVAVMKVENL